MIPKNRSLVPLCEARRAMLQAVEYVERRRERQTLRADFPYAQAFFRFLKGSKRITFRELRFFDPVLREEELRGRKREWLRAVDWLIESGGCATHPLPSDAARLLFPEVIFQCGERRHRKAEMRAEKYSRQFRRREVLKARAVQALPSWAASLNWICGNCVRKASGSATKAAASTGHERNQKKAGRVSGNTRAADCEPERDDLAYVPRGRPVMVSVGRDGFSLGRDTAPAFFEP